MMKHFCQTEHINCPPSLGVSDYILFVRGGGRAAGDMDMFGTTQCHGDSYYVSLLVPSSLSY